MSNTVNQKDYLKRYLSGDINKKKKQKREKKKNAALRKGLEIVDEDVGALDTIAYGYDAADEAPAIAEITYDCLETKLREEYNVAANKWKTTDATMGRSVRTALGTQDNMQDRQGGDGSGKHVSGETKKFKLSGEKQEKTINLIDKEGATTALTKVRRQRHDSDESPLRVERHDSDQSPIRGNKEDSGGSPPRRKRHDSPLRRKRHDNDESPLRRKRHDSDEPPPVRKRHDSDESPPRRKRHDSDEPPPGRKRHDSDESPPRRKRHDSDEPPPGRKRHDSDESPPRRKRHNSDQSPPRRNQQDSDGSLPRRKRRDSDESPPRRPKTSTSASNFEEIKRTGERIEKKMTTEEFLRARKRGKLKKDSEEDVARKEREAALQSAAEQQHKLWNRGVAQVQQQHAREAEVRHEMGKAFARSRDDEDMVNMLKEKPREGDTMLDYLVKKKQSMDKMPKKPEYQGQFPPNRFNIKPGYRWDGVDRSNGYEKEYFMKQANQIAVEDDAYRYCAEDM